ncbi:23S rRNA (adenine(2030)-N(6))-methyltransferase RlmJ [Lichenifustis flavocetrariae]|uniref:Ribosomal RNA large subunit methyltransferase J n=1 Tax=Lichenifustis flavocetrariae TaxID=2949735 RepID=A0AA42CGB9_9HYPH|nr:23S rRNA (adenine(2030)-N(6))-methyltransferase RlmJ [Lichenifustis flavocetrariae]MCW6506438.1 23S rRNA (adenine(2030)-N(6))-methyltransferase RlmJ [Lichenifustis flavocetrariae]
MNYRHAFHAGNFADVFKHLLLSRILVYLIRKPAPLRFIDTHAGIGFYDLAGTEAAKTGEWRTGIGRLDATKATPAVAALLDPYLAAVGARTTDGRPLFYPGSPGIAQHLLRPGDRLLLCERHPEDAIALKSVMGRDKRVKVLASDGYATLKASVPPPERRGLVLMDPPFEERDEFDTLAMSLASATRKWATGTYAIWYPIKEAAQVAAFQAQMATLGLARHCTIEILRDAAAGAPALRGCGLFVVNPPYLLAEEAALLLPFICGIFDDAALPPFNGAIRTEAGQLTRF